MNSDELIYWGELQLRRFQAMKEQHVAMQEFAAAHVARQACEVFRQLVLDEGNGGKNGVTIT